MHAGKADSTNKKYDSYFNKFRKWCELHSFSSLPATPNSLCLYISSLVFQHVSISVLDAVFYNINHFHIVSLRKNPCDEKLVKLCLESSKRLLVKPVNKKLPITVNMLKKIIDRYGKKDSTLSDLRTCTLCLLGFSEFFRYSELSNILMKYLEFFYTHLEINIQKSKTDIYRRGNTMVIAKTGNTLCPVSFIITLHTIS